MFSSKHLNFAFIDFIFRKPNYVVNNAACLNIFDPLSRLKAPWQKVVLQLMVHGVMYELLEM